MKMEISEIRKLAGISRAEMCRRYGIPVRTAEDWENGKGNAPQYVRDLLERAVREDYGIINQEEERA
jgi:putative transcriptional regulator